MVLATLFAAGCAEPLDETDDGAATPQPTVTAGAAHQATATPTAEPTREPEGAGLRDRATPPIDESELYEQLCDEIGGDWNPILDECDHPSIGAPPPDATDSFIEIALRLNDPGSALGVTEAEFVGRWNGYVDQHGLAADASLGDLRGFDLGHLYYVRNDILTVSLHVYLHEDGGELATVGVGSFRESFITWSTWRLAEAAMLGISPELSEAEATNILTTLTAGHEIDITGVDATLRQDGRLYRLIDGGGENGVWLIIVNPASENQSAVLPIPGP